MKNKSKTYKNQYPLKCLRKTKWKLIQHRHQSDIIHMMCKPEICIRYTDTDNQFYIPINKGLNFLSLSIPTGFVKISATFSHEGTYSKHNFSFETSSLTK